VVRKSIFWVEDNEDNQRFFVEAVKEIDQSICIYMAKNGREALDQLGSMSPLRDIIFMDINMSLMNGFEYLTLLKKHVHLKIIPVVILTRSNNPAETEVARELGAIFLLIKPSDPRLLKNNIRDILNLYQKNYVHVVIPFLQESRGPHIIPLLKERYN